MVQRCLHGLPSGGADPACGRRGEGEGRQRCGGVENGCRGSSEAVGVGRHLEHPDVLAGARDDEEDVGDLPPGHVVRGAGERAVGVGAHPDPGGGPGARFSGHGDRPDGGAVGERGQQPLTVVLGTGRGKQRHGEHGAGDERGRQQSLPGFLGDRLKFERAEPHSPVSVGHEHARHALVCQLSPEVAVESVVGGDDPPHVGFGTPLAQQLTDRRTQIRPLGRSDRHVSNRLSGPASYARWSRCRCPSPIRTSADFPLGHEKCRAGLPVTVQPGRPARSARGIHAASPSRPHTSASVLLRSRWRPSRRRRPAAAGSPWPIRTAGPLR